jgi:hypothetical protein
LIIGNANANANAIIMICEYHIIILILISISISISILVNNLQSLYEIYHPSHAMSMDEADRYMLGHFKRMYSKHAGYQQARQYHNNNNKNKKQSTLHGSSGVFLEEGERKVEGEGERERHHMDEWEEIELQEDLRFVHR